MRRVVYLGSYDDKWRRERSPEPPEDFRFDYYDAAHPDLQVEGYLKGNEELELVNLSPEGMLRFQLPGIKLTCTVAKSFEAQAAASSASAQEEGEDIEGMDMNEDFEEELEMDEASEEDLEIDEEVIQDSTIREEVNLNLDPLCLIPDEKRFYQVWRGLCPIIDLQALEVKTIKIQ